MPEITVVLSDCSEKSVGQFILSKLMPHQAVSARTNGHKGVPE